MKEHAGFLFALLAFAFSVLAFFSKASVSVDNGVLALVGICATLIVGIHVIDEINIRQIEKKTKELEKLIAELKRKGKKQDAIISLIIGMAMWVHQPTFALKESWKATTLAIKENDSEISNACIIITKWIISKIEKDEELKGKISNSKKVLPQEVPQEVKEAQLYGLIHKELEEIIGKFSNLMGT